MNSSLQNPLLIHGGSGKSLTVVPAQVNNYKFLEEAAKQGYYYPMLAIKQLKALSQGAAGKKYVYIPEINDAKANSLQMFYVYLPGIRATVERRPNDTYALTSLDLSEGYKMLEKGADKPGIYQVSNNNLKLQVRYKENGNITLEDNRTVIVCDGGYSQPEDAANDALRSLKKMSGEQAALRGEFDIVYSPVATGLGKKAYNPYQNTKAFASAVMLANAMKGASKRKGVYWVSQFGGSSVLTLAMRTLGDQNVTLPHHLAKLYKPRTSIEAARQAASKVGLKIGKDFASSPSIRGQFEQLHCNFKRVSCKTDDYSLKDYGEFLAKNALSANQLVGLPLYAASIPGATGVLGVAGMIVSGVGAGHLLWTLGKNLSDKPKFK